MDPRVDSPNAIEGTRVRGHDAVREYWIWQFGQFDPRVGRASRARRRGDPGPRHQSVLDLDGDLIGQGEVFHDYAFRDGLVAGWRSPRRPADSRASLAGLEPADQLVEVELAKLAGDRVELRLAEADQPLRLRAEGERLAELRLAGVEARDDRLEPGDR